MNIPIYKKPSNTSSSQYPPTTFNPSSMQPTLNLQQETIPVYRKNKPPQNVQRAIQPLGTIYEPTMFCSRLGKKTDNDYGLSNKELKDEYDLLYKHEKKGVFQHQFDYLKWNPQTPFAESDIGRNGINTRL